MQEYRRPVSDDSFERTISDSDIAQYEVTYDLWYTVHKWAEDNRYTFENAGRRGYKLKPRHLDVGGIGVEPGKRRCEPVTTVT